MADLFVNREVLIEFPFCDNVLFFQISSIAKQNRCTEFIVQETAFDVAAVGNGCPGVKGYNVAGHDSKGLGIFFGSYLFVRQHFYGIKGSSCLVVFSVYMDRGIAELTGAFINLSGTGDNTAVFRLRIVGIHTAKRGKRQTAVCFNFTNHGAKGIYMGFQKNGIFGVPAPKVYQNAAFNGFLRLVSQSLVFLYEIIGDFSGVSRRAVNGQQSF